MIIDIHTHVFPDKVAPKVVETNREMGFQPYGDGTLAGLERQIARTGLTRCVALGVATLPRLVEPTNDWLLQNKTAEMIVFGTIHPAHEEFEKEIKRVKRLGAKGIKFSSLFQDFAPDEKRMYPIYEAIVDEGLPILFHAGPGMYDVDSDEVKATPKRLRTVLEDFPGMKMIAAHWGGFHRLGEAKEHLWGKELYLDTSYPPGLRRLPQKEIMEFIQGHGVERILFGSDFPFGEMESDLRILHGLPIGESEKRQILFQNASRLLALSLESEDGL